MKKWLRYCLTFVVFVGCLSTGSGWAFAQTGISHMQVIPEPGRPVRIQPPGTPQPIEITSIRSISSPEEIAPDNPSPFTIICPDLTKIEVSPGETFSCPLPPPAAIVMVAVLPPPPRIKKNRIIKGKEWKNLTREEKNTLREAQKLIEELNVEKQPTQFLLANLYATYKLYDEAVTLLKEQPEILEDAAIMILLGTLYFQKDDLQNAFDVFQQALQTSQMRNDKEGQALAHYYLAVTFDKHGQYDESFTQHIQKGLKLCEYLGYADSELAKALQELLQHVQ